MTKFPTDFSKDLTVITNIRLADGIGRQGIGLIECLKNYLNLNVYHALPPVYDGLSNEFQQLVSQSFSGCGKISFWTFLLGLNESTLSTHASLSSTIKIAYSMFESDTIPSLWTRILNSYYDLVLVPDEWLVDVYRNSGVKIPIGVLPLGIMIEPFLEATIRYWDGTKPFTFGMTGGFWSRKNHVKLMEAFGVVFGNDERFKLKIHGRFGSYQNEVQKNFMEYAAVGLENMELNSGPLSQEEYVAWMNSLDCYVFPSAGEGFSITPREALALGKPVILTNNTAHQSLCRKGIVWPVKAEKKIPAHYEVFGNKQIGSFYDCDVNDLGKEMQRVFKEYNSLDMRQRCQIGREQARNYSWQALKPLYLQLFKPTSLTFDPSGATESKTLMIKPDGLRTNCPKLHSKLEKVIQHA